MEKNITADSYDELRDDQSAGAGFEETASSWYDELRREDQNTYNSHKVDEYE